MDTNSTRLNVMRSVFEGYRPKEARDFFAARLNVVLTVLTIVTLTIDVR
jgi:hypothetical protein